MASWNWVAKTLKNLKLTTPTGVTSSVVTGNNNGGPLVGVVQSRALSAVQQQQQVTVPAKPKRPLTPYFRFLGQVREGIKKQNPDLKITELMRKAGAEWDKLDEASKARYTIPYRKELEVYGVELNKYNEQLTPQQKEMRDQVKLEKQLGKEKREHRRRLKDLGKPKRPPTSFLVFLNSRIPTNQEVGIEEYKKLAKECGEKWRAMSEADRAPFVQKYKDEYVMYEKTLRKWEEKMIKQGNGDVVRVSRSTMAAPAKPRSRSSSTESSSKPKP